jgi:hypothetical protein
MNRNARNVLAVCLLAAGLVRADGTEVVSNPPTAVRATMTATTLSNGCVSWTASGKVSPHFNVAGASVLLQCSLFCLLSGNSGSCPANLPRILRFPTCSDASTNGDFTFNACGSQPVAANGTFSFQAMTVCPSDPSFPSLDPEYTCSFVVNAPAPTDPNGIGPCSGGGCPTSP